jgi:hypothetical protein
MIVNMRALTPLAWPNENFALRGSAVFERPMNSRSVVRAR